MGISSVRSRSGGIFQGKAIEAVVEVLAEVFWAMADFDIDVGRGDDAHIEL